NSYSHSAVGTPCVVLKLSLATTSPFSRTVAKSGTTPGNASNLGISADKASFPERLRQCRAEQCLRSTGSLSSMIAFRLGTLNSPLAEPAILRRVLPSHQVLEITLYSGLR